MTPELRRVLGRISVLLTLTALGFLLAEQAMRSFETSTAVDFLRMVGVTRVSKADVPDAITIRSGGGVVFDAVLSPSCSSLASLLALAGLALLRPPGRRTRLLFAVAAAMVLVFAGNILRIAASVGIGVLSGPSSLVLFHDWVGSMFGFAYTLGGFLLMLWLLLPRDGVPLERLCSDRPSPSQGADLRTPQIGPAAGRADA